MRTTTTRKNARSDHHGEWLAQLMVDVHKEIATHPSPRAIERIRQRLFAEIKTPARAAA